MMYEYLLPIGTVVKLKNAEKSVMIFGLLQKKDVNGITEMYDYVGVPYPVGYISPALNFVFNHSQIDEVVYNGFGDNPEWISFKKGIEFADKINSHR